MWKSNNDRCGFFGYQLPRNNYKFCIIENHEELKYDMDIQNSDYFTCGPWYNTSICKKLHGKLIEGFIINAGTDRYHIMCSIDAFEK